MVLFAPQQEVRLKNDPSTVGITTGIEREINGRIVVEVNVIGKGKKRYPSDQLELIVTERGIIDDIRERKFLSPEVLRTVLIHIQLSGRLADMIYSMESTNTDFYAFQFKPVVKLINSPSNGLLIADEVGLGKTIEAGLVWTELKSRFDAKNLLIFCPYALTKKWQAELLNKFDVRAEIRNAKQLLDVLNDDPLMQRGGAHICAMQSLRPDRGWDDPDDETGRKNQKELALKLSELAEGDPVFDLVIIDEAHHLRNSQTQLHQLGRLIRDVSDHAVFLSATPIHLRNKDLLAQLSLLDPGSFALDNEKQSLRAFENLLEANRPIMEAREYLSGNNNRAEVIRIIQNAKSNGLLSNSRTLTSCLNYLNSGSEPLSNVERSDLLAKLDTANLLSNIVTRTRRRDVEELRVVRQVYALKQNMSPAEEAFYEKVTFAVRRYADTKDIVQNFLLASPQRMMASCMYGALQHWRRYVPFEIEDAESELRSQKEDDKPLIDYMRQETVSVNLDELRESDSKYNALKSVLLSDYKEEKTVLFSSFKPTLNYLNERLLEDGLRAILISGDTKDRNQALEDFAAFQGQVVLLSSEVGSEGLDLQFCRTLINYDLPWNPMRVEQRIGRIDRVGQESQFISVLNFMHNRTIDQRIWDRLFDRLQLCQQALGGFEDIIGDEFRDIERSLLEGLTPEEENELLDQRAQAIANKKKEHDKLEENAAGLMAHGDYILNKVEQAHEFQRWMTGDDILKYISGFFAEYHPRSKVTIESSDKMLTKVSLDGQMRTEFSQFCQQKRIAHLTSMAMQSSTVAYFGRPPKRRNKLAEIVNQQHPLVRFATHSISTKRKTALRPAVSAEINVRECDFDISPSLYLVAIQQWTISGLTNIDKLAYAGTDLNTNQPLTTEVAERLANKVAVSAKKFNLSADCSTLEMADNAELLLDRLYSNFLSYKEDYESELRDKADFQLKNLEQNIEVQRESRRTAIKTAEENYAKKRQRGELSNPDVCEKEQKKLENTKRLNEGKIAKLTEKFELRAEQINQSLQLTEEATDVTTILIQVER